jgi:eukaryotic-like serine/threonine-protein kinase
VEAARPRPWSAVRERVGSLAVPTDRRTAVLAVVAAALVVAGLAGAFWQPATEQPAGAAVAAATSAVPRAPATAEAARLTDSDEPASTNWADVVTDLYERRAAAFTTGSAAALAEVYTPDSALLAADRRYVEHLAAAGEVLRGFAPTVVRVDAEIVTDDRVELALVDRWPAYEVVAVDAPDGTALRTEPGRPDSAAGMVLVRTADGWRIDSATRTS